MSLRLDVHIQKLQTACPLERTRLQFKMCIRSSWEELVWRWEFWVTPVTWSSPRAIFLPSCPTASLKIMVGTPSPCLPTTEHSLLRYGLGATTCRQLFLPTSPVSPESSSSMVTLAPTECLTCLPRPDCFWDLTLPCFTSAADTRFSAVLLCASFHNGWVSSSFHPWPPSLFLSYLLPG